MSKTVKCIIHQQVNGSSFLCRSTHLQLPMASFEFRFLILDKFAESKWIWMTMMKKLVDNMVVGLA